MGVRSILTSLAFSTIFVGFLSWKYKWDFSILNKRIEKQEEEVVAQQHQYHAVNIAKRSEANIAEG